MEDEVEKEFWEVEKIVGRKTLGGKLYYRVKWVGFSMTNNTWEPLSNLENVQYMIDEFEQQLQGGKLKSTTKTRGRPARISKSAKVPPDNTSTIQDIQNIQDIEVKSKAKGGHKLLKNSKKIKKFPKSSPTKNLKNLSKYIRRSYHSQTEKTQTEKTHVDDRILKQGDFSLDICDKICGHVCLMNEITKRALKDNDDLGLKVNDLYYKVKWIRRPNGYLPRPSYFQGHILQKKIPEEYIDYLENNLFVE